MMNSDEIKKILPHRDNMLLLDAVDKETEIKTDKEKGTETEVEYAHGYFRIPEDAWFLKGHFPGNPVVPGVILCEILAQSTCILLSDQMTAGKTPMYTGLNNVKFRSPVLPGDLFETKCRVTRVKYPFFFAEGSGFVNGRLCVKAEFSFAITEK